jgi:hypothetical protein
METPRYFNIRDIVGLLLDQSRYTFIIHQVMRLDRVSWCSVNALDLYSGGEVMIF